MSKRLIALLLALVLCVGMLAACGGNGDETTKGNDDTTAGTDGGDDTTAGGYVTPNLNGAKITYYTSNNTDYDPEDSYVNKLVESHLNADIEVIEIQGEEVAQLLMQGKVPDLHYRNSWTSASFQDIYDGAYINIYDYLDQMPNVKAWLEKPENAMHLTPFISGDGKTLGGIPIIQVGGSGAKYGFLYRKDIFEKNNIEIPTNQEEFMQVLRDLKKIYPDSYPFMLRNMKGNFQGAEAFGYLWGGHHMLNGYFGTYFTLDENGEFYWGTTSQAYKEMAQFFLDLEKEGLFNPSSWTADTTAWNNAYASDTSFIGYDKVDRLPSINGVGLENNPDFVMSAFTPFNFGTHANDEEVYTILGNKGTGYCWTIGNGDNLENVLKYVDWLYSDEAYVMTNWGKENESYVVNADGTKSFKEGFLESFGSNGLVLSGLWSALQSGRTDFDAYYASLDENMKEALTATIPTDVGGPTQYYLKFIGKEVTRQTDYGKPGYTYALGEFAKFCTGQRDMSEWDQVEEELRATYQFDEMLADHQNALKRLLGE